MHDEPAPPSDQEIQPPAPSAGAATAGRQTINRDSTLVLGAAGGAGLVLLILAILAATSLLQIGRGPAGTGSRGNGEISPLVTPTPPASAGSSIAVAGAVPAAEAATPELPATIDVAPLDVPWASGDTVTVTNADGANLRPYPVADDDLAAATIGLAQGTELQIISTFRLDMSDGHWWYVRVPSSDESVVPAFGWIREDLLQPAAAEAATLAHVHVP